MSSSGIVAFCLTRSARCTHSGRPLRGRIVHTYGRSSRFRRAWLAHSMLAAAGLLIGAALAPTRAHADVFYVYDDLNRLVAVVDAQGNAATYTYDAVGNILQIDRVDAAQQPGPVRITLITPTAGKVGTKVQIFGTGFSATPAQNSVTFTGAGASVTGAGPTRLLTTVPSGAATGPISVTAPLGSATSQVVFR